jgi:hypothetical protein
LQLFQSIFRGKQQRYSFLQQLGTKGGANTGFNRKLCNETLARGLFWASDEEDWAIFKAVLAHDNSSLERETAWFLAATDAEDILGMRM